VDVGENLVDERPASEWQELAAKRGAALQWGQYHLGRNLIIRNHHPGSLAGKISKELSQ